MVTHQHTDRCPGISLPDVPCGCKLLVENLTGSAEQRSRLYAMGILPGTELEVCQSGNGRGSVCVRVRQSSLVLGENMAKTIVCRPIDENDVHNHHHPHHHHHRHHHEHDGLWGWCRRHLAGSHEHPGECCCEKKKTVGS